VDGRRVLGAKWRPSSASSSADSGSTSSATAPKGSNLHAAKKPRRHLGASGKERDRDELPGAAAAAIVPVEDNATAVAVLNSFCRLIGEVQMSGSPADRETANRSLDLLYSSIGGRPPVPAAGAGTARSRRKGENSTVPQLLKILGSSTAVGVGAIGHAVDVSTLCGRVTVAEHGFSVQKLLTTDGGLAKLRETGNLAARCTMGIVSLPGVESGAIHNINLSGEPDRHNLKFRDLATLQAAGLEGGQLANGLLPLVQGVNGLLPLVFGESHASTMTMASNMSILLSTTAARTGQVMHTDRDSSEIELAGDGTALRSPLCSGVCIVPLGDNGCYLDVWPRSHARFQSRAEDEMTAALAGTGISMMRLFVPAGYVLFLSAYTVHRGVSIGCADGQPRLHAFFDSNDLPPVKDAVYILNDHNARLLGLALPPVL